MFTSICPSCRSLLLRRLRSHISYLQTCRRSNSSTSLPKESVSNPLSWYGDTAAPTASQLLAADAFFRSHPPRKLWTATEWRKQNNGKTPTLTPEVAFLGRSNVGKSSLLNALLLSPRLNHVGPRPGKTTTMHAWALAPTDPSTGGAVKGMKGDMETKCAVLDMPGYGHASHGDWGDEIMSYLKNRKQLKRAFVLMDPTHGMKSGDKHMLELLRKEGIPHQIVASKCDRFGPGPKGMEDAVEAKIQELWVKIQSLATGPGLSVLGEVLAVSALGDGRKNDKLKPGAMRGVREVQWAVLRACGLDAYAMNKAYPKSLGGHHPDAPLHPPGALKSKSIFRPAPPFPRNFPPPSLNASLEPAQVYAWSQCPPAPLNNSNPRASPSLAQNTYTEPSTRSSATSEGLSQSQTPPPLLDVSISRPPTVQGLVTSASRQSQSGSVGRGIDELMAMTSTKTNPSARSMASGKAQSRSRRGRPVPAAKSGDMGASNPKLEKSNIGLKPTRDGPFVPHVAGMAELESMISTKPKSAQKRRRLRS